MRQERDPGPANPSDFACDASALNSSLRNYTGECGRARARARAFPPGSSLVSTAELHLNKLPKWNLSPFILRTRYWLPGEIFFSQFHSPLSSCSCPALPSAYSLYRPLCITWPLSFCLSCSRAPGIFIIFAPYH